MVSARSLVHGAAVALVSAAVALACGPSTSGAPVTAELSACSVSPGCPDAGTSYSYANDIAPILDQACTPCHGPGGTAGFDETSWASIEPQESPMLDQVASCQMPPLNGPALTAAQRLALTQWLQCGAPDN